jgi:hypothetical protein
MTANLGILMFEQAKPISVQEGNSFRTAPYAAIGFDFDAANRIADLLKAVMK